MANKNQITLIVPVYNEAGRWPHEYWEHLISLEQINWIFVNDGSNDTTRDVLDRISLHTNVEVLELVSNSGKAEAIRIGFNHVIARQPSDSMEVLPSIVGFLDADGAFSSVDIREITQKSLSVLTIENSDYDAIWSSRVALSGHKIERTLHRHYLGRIINTLLGASIPNMPYDTQCGFKLFAITKNLRSCMKEQFTTKWLFDIEILLRSRKEENQGIRILEIPLKEWQEKPGGTLGIKSAFTVIREVSRVSRIARSKEKINGSY